MQPLRKREFGEGKAVKIPLVRNRIFVGTQPEFH